MRRRHLTGRPTAAPRRALRALLLLALGCAGGDAPAPRAPDDPGGRRPLRVLFVGNSLTYTHDLPARVQALAEAAGTSLARRTLAGPGLSLEDHWARGAGEAIRSFAPDVVVLQQGPSSLPRSRRHLLRWARHFARAARAVGGRPALLMVWPGADRREVFGAVRASYAAAAREAEGLFVPAGEAWRAAWRRDPGLRLYGPDGFHPSRTGTLVAALAVFGALAGGDPAALPCPLAAGPSGGVPAPARRVACEAVREVLEPAGEGASGGRRGPGGVGPDHGVAGDQAPDVGFLRPGRRQRGAVRHAR